MLLYDHVTDIHTQDGVKIRTGQLYRTGIDVIIQYIRHLNKQQNSYKFKYLITIMLY